MRFDGSLGNVQIASDFRVVTSLKKQINNLPLPWPHLIEFLFHNHLHLTEAPKRRNWRGNQAPSAHLDSGPCVSFCIHAAKSRFRC